MDLFECSIFDDVLPLKTFSQMNITEYILKLNHLNEKHGESACLKECLKGQKMFQAKFINDVKFKQDDDYVFIRASVRAEYKKIVYEVQVTVGKESNEVITSLCCCPGGTAPAGCKHTFSVLTFIAEYCTKELFNAPTEILQKWHQPSKKRKCSPKKVDDFIRRPLPNSVIVDTSIDFSALAHLSYGAPIFSIISDKDFSYKEMQISKTLPLPAFPFTHTPNSLPAALLSSEILFLHSQIIKSLEECFNLEKETMFQNNNLWNKERALRLTASNFHSVLIRRKDHNKLSQDILRNKDISHIPAVCHGINNESKVKKMVANKYQNFCFRDVGFIVNPKYPYLGASPDGLLYGDDAFLVEIKCTFDTENVPLKELLEKPNFCLEETSNGTFCLKKSHKYYAQIQGQLAVSDLKCCFFALYHSSSAPLYIAQIYFDQEWWNTALNILKNFYFTYHLKNIMEKYPL